MSTPRLERFRDPGTRIEDLVEHDVVVQCPRCEARALVRRLDEPPVRSEAHPKPSVFAPRRFTCTSCAKTDEWPGGGTKTVALGGPVDPWFRLPLWLQGASCGELLWAYNVEHLDLLEAFVGARVRERAPFDDHVRTVVERLPTWLKDPSNRAPILRSLSKLRSRLWEG